MNRNKKIQFWVTTHEYETLKKVAEFKEVAMAEVLRDYIKSLDTGG